MKNKSKKGFTLVEIMIVVVIIGLLTAMAIPAFQGVRERSLRGVMDNDARQISSAAAQYFLEADPTVVAAGTVTVADLVNGNPAVSNGTPYLSGISNQTGLALTDVIAAGGTFQLVNPSVNGGQPVTYEVDTGREQPAGNNSNNSNNSGG